MDYRRRSLLERCALRWIAYGNPTRDGLLI
jgi:hypothetical protein